MHLSLPHRGTLDRKRKAVVINWSKVAAGVHLVAAGLKVAVGRGLQCALDGMTKVAQLPAFALAQVGDVGTGEGEDVRLGVDILLAGPKLRS